MRLNKLLSKLTIFSDTQLGFRQGCATQAAINKLAEFAYAVINERKFTKAFFFECSEVFDTVNHRMLPQKLG